MEFTPTILESPYAGNIESNTMYARYCMHDMIVNYKEAPYASHLLYTQEKVLDDAKPEEREMGIMAGFAFKSICAKTVIYTDLGISKGMEMGAQASVKDNKEVIYRTLPNDLYNDFIMDSHGY